MKITIRPSLLPKLQKCRNFYQEESFSEYAQRGSLLDKAYRAEDLSILTSEEEKEAVAWAITNSPNTVKNEEECKIPCSFLDGYVGTCDAVDVTNSIVYDLKTGQERDYEAQLAAYALGLMDKHNKDQWIGKVLFCDIKVIQTYFFTRKSAQALIQSIISAPEEPTLCEYCSYCARKAQCPAFNAEAVKAIIQKDTFASILSNPLKIEVFLVAAKKIEEYVEMAKRKAIEYHDSGHRFETIKVIERKGTDKVVIDALVAEQLKKLEPEILKNYIKITPKEAQKLNLNYVVTTSEPTKYIKI